MLKCSIVISCKKSAVRLETGKLSNGNSGVKSFVTNILPITPTFPIFCGREIISPESNSFEPRNLARSHKKYRDIDMHPAAAFTQSSEKNRTTALNPEPVSPRTRELGSPRL
jgi:hypothetical protein